MPIRCCRRVIADQQGMALLVTVMTLAILVVVTVQFSRDNWHGLLVSHNYGTRVRLRTMAESGVNLGIALLQKDVQDDNSDTLLDDWANTSGEEYTNLFENGRLKLSIADLSGRIPINSLAAADNGQNNDNGELQLLIKKVLLNLLLSENFALESENEAREIVDAISDWLDEDDEELDQGAESSFYQSLAKPYSCRNGPLQYIEELLLIRGISREIFFGDSEKPGLAAYITIHGDDGKININTANEAVISALEPLISDDLIQSFIEFRKDRENREMLARVDWYASIGGWPGDIVLNEKLTTVESRFFTIEVVAEMEETNVKIVADVGRTTGNSVNILNRTVE
jgi:general secretion pathway protein K